MKPGSTGRAVERLLRVGNIEPLSEDHKQFNEVSILERL